jgi:orotate phosphoribosyltransferase
MLNKQQLIHSLYEIGVIQFGEFTLKSGQTTTIYINLRKIIAYPSILRYIANIMWTATRGCQFDLICGVPYTALPIATCISIEHDIPMVLKRKEKKTYGAKQIVEGEFSSGQRCLVIEDIITTGSSILETARELEIAGLHVTDLVALVDREQKEKDPLLMNYNLHTMLPLPDMLRTLLDSDLIDTKQHSIIHQLLCERNN